MINNDFYRELGERWHTSEGDAVSLLRLENQTKFPWVLSQIERFHSKEGTRVLDIGCGGGFLTLALARNGYLCTGLDVDDAILAVGRGEDREGKIDWVVGEAGRLPFADRTFDVICIMDVLEHVRDPRQALAEAARVLDTRGTLLLHTFNRTWLSWLFAAKGLDWFIKDSPRHVHEWAMFLKPSEIVGWLDELGIEVKEFRGIHPEAGSVLRLLYRRRVPSDFRFRLGGGLSVGFLGCARWRESR